MSPVVFIIPSLKFASTISIHALYDGTRRIIYNSNWQIADVITQNLFFITNAQVMTTTNLTQRKRGGTNAPSIITDKNTLTQKMHEHGLQ